MTDIYKAPEAELTNPTGAGEFGSVEKALAGDYQLKPIELLERAWANLKGMKTTYWIAIVVYGVIYGALGFLVASTVGKSFDPITGDFSLMALIAELGIGLIVGPMAAGLFVITLKSSVGVKTEVGELFKHYDKMIPLFLVNLLYGVLVILGMVFLIVPGIYLAIALVMAMPLVIDKGMSPWEALMTSRKAVTHQWFSMLGFGLLSIFVLIAGAIALLIGLVWAVPLVMLATAMLYRDMFGIEDSTING